MSESTALIPNEIVLASSSFIISSPQLLVLLILLLHMPLLLQIQGRSSWQGAMGKNI
jgi:hypothetical protein